MLLSGSLLSLKVYDGVTAGMFKYTVEYLICCGAMTINVNEYKCRAWTKFSAWRQFLKATVNEDHYTDRTVLNNFRRMSSDIKLCSEGWRMKNCFKRAYLQIVTAGFKTPQWWRDFRFIVGQGIIDFTESRRKGAATVGDKRASQYGDRSWQWHWTFWQERFWDRVGWKVLEKL